MPDVLRFVQPYHPADERRLLKKQVPFFPEAFTEIDEVLELGR